MGEEEEKKEGEEGGRGAGPPQQLPLSVKVGLLKPQSGDLCERIIPANFNSSRIILFLHLLLLEDALSGAAEAPAADCHFNRLSQGTSFFPSFLGGEEISEL